MKPLNNKRIIVTGGTGSLGQKVVHRILGGSLGTPESVTVFSRDEAKQHYMRLSYLNRKVATDDVIYKNYQEILQFQIGNIRDYPSVVNTLKDKDIIIHTAALKQVPTCEYFPYQAVMTNIQGAENVVRAITENDLPIETVVAISTDKACKPVNVMGMTKSIMERIFIKANLSKRDTRFVAVRYGNVIASRGSVIPLFLDQIEKGGPVTVTDPEMTRFFITLPGAVDTIFQALEDAYPGEIYIPQLPSTRILDLARSLIGKRDISVKIIGTRPGEKLHEIMISEEERFRTIERSNYYVIHPMLPDLQKIDIKRPILNAEYSSAEVTMSENRLKEIVTPFIETH